MTSPSTSPRTTPGAGASGGARRWLVPAAILVVMAAILIGLEIGTDLSTDQQRWVWSGGLLAIALVVAFVRFLRTGRWGPTDAEARENARDMGSNRTLLVTLAFGVVVAVVAVVTTGEWWAALIALVVFAVRGLIDRATWRWFANR